MRTALVVLALFAVACGGDDPNDWESGRPRIDDLRYLQQVPGDPLALQVEVSFVDDDGDLGGGMLHLELDGEPSGQLSMIDVFERQTPKIALDATEGEIEVIVRLTQDVDVGTTVRVGVVLEDRQKNRSNEPYFELRAF